MLEEGGVVAAAAAEFEDGVGGNVSDLGKVVGVFGGFFFVVGGRGH